MAFNNPTPTPVVVTTANGADVTQGAIADAAVATDAPGTVNAHLRGIVKLLAGKLGVTTADGDSIALGAIADAAVATDAPGTVNAHLRGIVKLLAGKLGVTTADGDSIALGAIADAAVATDAAGTVNAHLRGIVKLLVGVASGAADSGNPIKTGGKFNLNSVTFADGQRADTQANKFGWQICVLGDPTLDRKVGVSVASADALTASANALNAATYALAFNGASWDRLRTPVIFKTFSNLVITGEQTIWTPAGGKKFRLMGIVISQGVLTGDVILKDNTAGATIFVVPANVVGNSIFIPLGNGILSGAANRVLTATGVATETISGVVFGTEE